jgi:hypothetical protein
MTLTQERGGGCHVAEATEAALCKSKITAGFETPFIFPLFIFFFVSMVEEPQGHRAHR